MIVTPRNPTDAEFHGISEALTGDRQSIEVANRLIAVFDAPGDQTVAVVTTRTGTHSWSLVRRPEYWVIKSVGEPSDA